MYRVARGLRHEESRFDLMQSISKFCIRICLFGQRNTFEFALTSLFCLTLIAVAVIVAIGED